MNMVLWKSDQGSILKGTKRLKSRQLKFSIFLSRSPDSGHQTFGANRMGRLQSSGAKWALQKCIQQ